MGSLVAPTRTLLSIHPDTNTSISSTVLRALTSRLQSCLTEPGPRLQPPTVPCTYVVHYTMLLEHETHLARRLHGLDHSILPASSGCEPRQAQHPLAVAQFQLIALQARSTVPS